MLINIRGTSGSGKTTLALEIMELYEEMIPRYLAGRKRPIGYVLKRSRASYLNTSLFVLGSYANACGGVDTISSREEQFKLILGAHERGMDVLAEGVLLSDEVKRTLTLQQAGVRVLVVGLNTPIEQCVQNINTRRRKKNPAALPVNPANTENRVRNIQRAMERLKEAGISAVWFSYSEASNFIRTELGLALEA